MSTTTNLEITTLATGQAQKEATINDALIDIDATLAGLLSKSVAGSSNVNLTNDEARNADFIFTGVLTGNIEVRWPASGGSARNLRVYNATTGAFTLTLTVAGGSGVAITQGEIHDYFIDGTTVRPTNVTAGTYTALSAQAVWARVYHNVVQALTTATLTALTFNTERNDTDTIHDTVTNNSRLTCKTAGLYSITANVGFASNATGIRELAIRLNGTTFLAIVNQPAVSGLATELTIHTLYPLAVNDYVEVMAYQSSGGSLNTDQAGNYSPEFMCVRLGGV